MKRMKKRMMKRTTLRGSNRRYLYENVMKGVPSGYCHVCGIYVFCMKHFLT